MIFLKGVFVYYCKHRFSSIDYLQNCLSIKVMIPPSNPFNSKNNVLKCLFMKIPEHQDMTKTHLRVTQSRENELSAVDQIV